MANNRKSKGNLTWAKAFDDYQDKKGNQPTGDDWQTMEQLRQELNIGVCRLHKFLREGVENGQVEIFDGSQMGKNGRLVRAIWYRLK